MRLYCHRKRTNSVTGSVTDRGWVICLTVILTILVQGWGSFVYANTLEQQRDNYRAAQKALRAGKIKTFNKLTAALQDYPLYPYLRHDYLKSRLWKVKDDAVFQFLKQYDDLPMANNLRSNWLKLLVR